MSEDRGEKAEREYDFRVLLIEDDDIDSETVRRHLERQHAHRFYVRACNNLQESRQAISEEQFDVVLLDLSLPDEFGIAAVERVREFASTIPIIILTGNDDLVAEFESLRRGAQDYLTKQQLTGNNLVRSIRHSIERQTLARELEDANRLAESANRAKSEFLANMSHEIRTPLTAILGFAEILNRDIESLEPAERSELVVRMQYNGGHLLSLIDDILDLSKIEVGKIVLEEEICEARTILDEVIAMMALRASDKNLKLQLSVHDNIPKSIVTDPSRLRQILVNLIGNAIKFTEVGKVHVECSCSANESGGSSLVVSVADTGIGLSTDQLSRLFRPFVQADSSTTRRFGGTGLGLTISKRLAEMLGGTITVKSRPSEGSIFSLLLPLPTDAFVTPSPDLISADLKTPNSVADAPRTSESASSDSPMDTLAKPVQQAATNNEKLPTQSLHGRRILLAEDGVDNQQLISFVLSKAGAEVVVKEDGKQAMKAILDDGKQGRPYDLVLMDMQMPVLDGYAATSRLRAAGFIGPIIAITAHAMSSDRQKCLDAGCDDYVPKPIKRDDLIRLVSKYCRTVRRANGSLAPRNS